MISKWRASAKNLLYHFRCVFRGMVPFSPSWDPKKQRQVELDAMSLEYIQTMSKIIVQRSKLMSSFFKVHFLLPLAMSMTGTNTSLYPIRS
jgi:hypothetical protein